MHGTTTDDASPLTATLLQDVATSGYMTDSVVALQESYSEVVMNV